MNTMVSASNLLFFKAVMYKYHLKKTFDFSTCPRPHFCMGLITKGSAEFTDKTNNNVIKLSTGDIVFVPMGARYISSWYGDEIEYISMHFIFGAPSLFARENSYLLQKIAPNDYVSMQNTFECIIKNYSDNDREILLALSKFYFVLSEITPKLAKKENIIFNPKIISSIQYIEQHYHDRITIEELATNVQMSVSRFFPFFKRELGVTPIDYINNYRISQAILLLIGHKSKSIEDIAELTGFESSAYFRRVFKKNTGISPREYRKTSLEL